MFFAGLLASCFRYEQQPQPQATQSLLVLLEEGGTTRDDNNSNSQVSKEGFGRSVGGGSVWSSCHSSEKEGWAGGLDVSPSHTGPPHSDFWDRPMLCADLKKRALCFTSKNGFQRLKFGTTLV